MNKNKLEIKKSKIIIIGDVMLDRYWHGDTNRISPEAPVPVVKINEIDNRAGGAANVAVNISALGANAHLIGLTGYDDEAKILINKLTSNNVFCDFEQNKNIKTITKLRVLSRHQQLLRLDFESEIPKQENTILSRLINSIDNCKVIVLSDYAKGTLTQIKEIIALANKNNIPVLIDPKGSDYSKYKGATLLTPNMTEFEVVVGKCNSEDEIISKGKKLIDNLNLEALLITRSEKGMTLITKNELPLNLNTKAKEVFDVTGAGDTVISTLATLLASDYTIKDSCYYSNIAAGIVVGKLGTSIVTKNELENAIAVDSLNLSNILTTQELLDQVFKAKAQGKKVVMTNGCFDILHAGHVSYLKEAKKLGDKLIVAINTDESVKKLKGNERPINTLNERMAIMAELNSVDWVTAFAEETPQNLIAQILPNVLVKGGDYSVEQIAGAKEVLENGGEVIILNFKDGCSTTNIINKIKKQ